MANGVTLIVGLYLQPGREARFREFETRALALLRDHGGRLEKAIRITASVGGEAAPYEVHIVWFPSEAHLASHRNDPRLTDLAVLRTEAIARTTILEGQEIDAYR
jgi:uncharacterized protein (DUF1330 family)